MKTGHLKLLLSIFVLGFILTIFSYYLSPFYFPQKDITAGRATTGIRVGYSVSRGSPWSYYANFYIDRSNAPDQTFYKEHPEIVKQESEIYENIKKYDKKFRIFSFIADLLVWSLFVLIVIFCCYWLADYYLEVYKRK